MPSIRVTTYKWLESEVPTSLEVRQVYGFIFSPNGRLLLLEDEGGFNLPGGKPENDENLSDTLIREAREEVQVRISFIEYLGYQLIEDDEKYAQVRMVCLVDEIFPARKDPSTGRIYSRLWIPPRDANDLLVWGESGDQQIKSAVKAASALGANVPARKLYDT